MNISTMIIISSKIFLLQWIFIVFFFWATVPKKSHCILNIILLQGKYKKIPASHHYHHHHHHHHNNHYHHPHPHHCTHPSAADCIWGGWPSTPRRSSRTHGPEFAEIRIFNQNLRCFYFISILILYIQIGPIFSAVEQIFIKALPLTIHQLLWTDLQSIIMNRSIDRMYFLD